MQIRKCLLTAMFSAAALLGPGASPAQEVRDPLNPGSGPGPAAPEEPSAADLSEAGGRIGAGDYAGAEELLVPLLDRFPDDPALLLMLGEVRLALGRADEALPLLSRAAEISPERQRVQFQLGSALAAAGKNEEALTAFGRELENTDNREVRIMALLNRSFLLQNLKRWVEAAGELARVVELDPSRPRIFGDAASLYIQAGEPDKAEEILDAGLEHGFESAQHYYSVGAAFYRKQMYGEAASAYRKCLGLRPDFAKAERGLGLSLEQGGMADEAAEHFRKYLELAPDARDRDRILAAIGEN